MSARRRTGDTRSREALVERALEHLWPDTHAFESTLVVGTFRSGFIQSLQSRADSVQGWSRWATAQTPGTPWPPSNQHARALIRLPKSKDEFDFVLKASVSTIPVGHHVWVVGANDEGIKSATKVMDKYLGGIVTIGSKHHCRLLRGTRTPTSRTFQLDDLEWTTTLDLKTGPIPWHAMPGVFAKGRLDEATALLIDTVPTLKTPRTVLDFACGTGPLAHQVHTYFPDADISMIDADSVAVHVARKNVGSARGYVSDGWSNVPMSSFDLIVSNPPIHTGKAEDHRILNQLIADATDYLSAGGQLVLVGQGRLNLGQRLSQHFRTPQCLTRTSRFQVWSSR